MEPQKYFEVAKRERRVMRVLPLPLHHRCQPHQGSNSPVLPPAKQAPNALRPGVVQGTRGAPLSCKRELHSLLHDIGAVDKFQQNARSRERYSQFHPRTCNLHSGIPRWGKREHDLLNEKERMPLLPCTGGHPSVPLGTGNREPSALLPKVPTALQRH